MNLSAKALQNYTFLLILHEVFTAIFIIKKNFCYICIRNA